MGKHTNIQWSDSTVNFSTGCDGCELWKLLQDRGDLLNAMGGPCYAGNLHEGRLSKTLPTLYDPDFTKVRLAPGRMVKAAGFSDLTGTKRPGKPWLDGMPRIIFLGDMGDALSKAVPFDYLKTEMIDNISSPKGSRHIYMLLTKRPGRMAEFAEWLLAEHGSPWPNNLWPGTSITGRASLKRIDALLKVPSNRRFLSLEPLIETVDVSQWLRRPEVPCPDGREGCEVLHLGPSPIALAIIGGESRQPPHEPRPFDLRWARELIGQCRDADVKAFVKQLGSRPVEYASIAGANAMVRLKDSHGGDWDEWPSDLRIRQFPTPEAP